MVGDKFASFDLGALAWAQLWQVTFTILLAAVLARFCCRRRPHLAYLLWMLVIVKALAPPVLASRAGIYSWLLRTEAPIAAVAAAAPRDEVRPLPTASFEYNFERPRSLRFDERVDPGPAQVKSLDDPAWLAELTLRRALFAMWLCGVVALGLYVTGKWWACRRRWLDGSVPVPPSFDQHVRYMARRLELSATVARKLRILASRAADSPAVYGLWAPTMLLPADLVQAGAGERQVARLDAILAHELIHLRRGDTAAALLQLIAQLAWWFHPLMWFANREARRAREMACDEEVVTGLGCRPAEYARALLDVLELQTQKQPAFAVPGVGMLGVTTRRLNHLLHQSHSFHQRTPWTYYLTALAVLLLILPGAGLQLAAAPAGEEPTAAQSTAAERKATDATTGAGSDASSSPPHKPAEPTIIVTGNVILWDNRIVSWDQMVLRFRTMRADGPIHPHFKFTEAAFANGSEDRFQKRLVEIYKEVFEPEGMSLGSMIPRASARLDCIRSEDDLRPDPALARKGRVLTPEGKVAVGAQVIVVPPREMLSVVLAGKGLRDPANEQLTATDEEGHFTVYPEGGDYCLVILHDAGCDARPVPAVGEPVTVQLGPWASVRFTSTGGVKDQSADVTVDPVGIQQGDLRFQVYEAKVEREPIEVLVPAGRIVVGRSLKMDEGSSVSMPVEQFDLAAGASREAALAPPTAVDRKRAEEVQQPMRVARQRAAAEREKKAKEDAGPEVEKSTASRPGAEGGEKSDGERAGNVDTNAAENAARVDSETKQSDGATPSASAPAKKEREFKPTGRAVFVPAGAVPLTDPDPQQPAAAKREEPAAVRRLRDLGAFVEPAPYDGDPSGEAWNVTIRQGWKGTDDDLKLINEVPDVAFLYFDLTAASAAGIGGIKLAAPAELLTINDVTDESVAKISGLPIAKRVTLAGCSLSAAGCERLARLAEGVENLTLQGVWDPKNRQAPPTGVDDAGLKAIGQLKRLTYLELVYLGITDSGLMGLHGLEQLREFRIIVCPGVRGSGYAALTSLEQLRDFSAYMMPLTGEGLAGLSQLAHLEHIHFQLDRGSAAALKSQDFAPLARLSRLQTLDFVDPENPWAVTGKTPPRQDELAQAALGNALLEAVAKAPQLRDLQVEGLGGSAVGLAALADARELRSLSLRPMSLNDASLATLGRLTGLTRLGISGPGGIQPASLARLAPLTKLKWLSIHRGVLTDEALTSLAPLVSLENLDLPDSNILGPGLAALVKLARLKSLALVRAPLDDAGCQSLATLAALEDLNLSETKITDRALGFLIRLPNLRSLDLTGTAVTTDGLGALAELKSLKSLRVEGLKASGEDLAKLRKKLPRVAVDVIGNAWVMSAPDNADASDEQGASNAPNTFEADRTNSPAKAEKKVAGPEPAKKDATKDTVFVYSAEEPAAKKEEKRAAPDAAPPEAKGAAKAKKSQAPSVHYVSAVPLDIAERSREAAGVHAITISGRATDGDDKAVIGATVFLVALGLREPVEVAQAKTDADGRYEFRDAKLPLSWPEHPQGNYQVYATAPGRGLAWQGARSFSPEKRPAGDRDNRMYADDVLVADLKFGQEATLCGRLLDEAGTPIKDAKVKVVQARHLASIGNRNVAGEHYSDRFVYALIVNPLTTTTDDDGRFAISGLTRETSAFFNVAHPDFGETSYEVALTDDPVDQPKDGRKLIVGEANLRLERTQHVKLRLLYDTASQPAASTTISAWRQGVGDHFASGKTESDGSATLTLSPGMYELTIKPERATAPDGYLETKLPFVVPKEKQEQPTIVRLPAGCTLDVEVVDVDTGKPVPQVGIANSWDIEGEQWRQLRIIGQTDEAGRFRQVVPAGKRYYGPVPQRVYDVAENTHPTAEKPIDLPGGQTVKLQFKMRKRVNDEKPNE